MDISDIFREIEDWSDKEPVALAELRLLETGVRLPTGPALAGIDTEDRHHLLLPLPGKPKTKRVDDSCRGILIRERPLVEGSTERWFADVECRDAALNHLFSSVAQEMLDALRDAPGANPFNKSVQVLARWRDLLGRVPGTKLSDEKLAGIWAELHVLIEIADRERVDPLSAWQGPFGATHDFLVGGTGLECKATTKKEGWTITINGLKQLQPPENEDLVLCVFRLRRSADGETVPSLIQRAAGQGIDHIKILEALRELGYSAHDEDFYSERAYAIQEVRSYRVADGFPSLVPKSLKAGKLPDAIRSVTYSLDLGSAEAFKIGEGENALEVLNDLG